MFICLITNSIFKGQHCRFCTALLHIADVSNHIVIMSSSFQCWDIIMNFKRHPVSDLFSLILSFSLHTLAKIPYLVVDWLLLLCIGMVACACSNTLYFCLSVSGTSVWIMWLLWTSARQRKWLIIYSLEFPHLLISNLICKWFSINVIISFFFNKLNLWILVFELHFTDEMKWNATCVSIIVTCLGQQGQDGMFCLSSDIDKHTKRKLCVCKVVS